MNTARPRKRIYINAALIGFGVFLAFQFNLVGLAFALLLPLLFLAAPVIVIVLLARPFIKRLRGTPEPAFITAAPTTARDFDDLDARINQAEQDHYRQSYGNDADAAWEAGLMESDPGLAESLDLDGGGPLER